MLAPPFRLTWLLLDELAIGSAPLDNPSLDCLAQEGFASVFSLCAGSEAPVLAALPERFHTRRLVLPDHRSGRWPEPREVGAAVAALADLRIHGAVFMHCAAGVERSPLVAMAWLMVTRRLSLESALAYVQFHHPGTDPFPQQLEALRAWHRQPRDPRMPSPSQAVA